MFHRLGNCSPRLEQAQVGANGQAERKWVLSDWAKAQNLRDQDVKGLLFDRDALAFYGDPAWAARMAKAPLRWDQSLVEKDGTWTFTIRPNASEQSFAPVNSNGSQRGFRPIIEFLPKRITNVRVLQGSDLQPVITDDFIVVPNPKSQTPAKEYTVVFRAELL